MATSPSRRNPNDTRAAALPSLPAAPRSVDEETRRWMESVREWLEVRHGSRGDVWERAVTLREYTSDANGVDERLVALESSTTASATASAIAQLQADLSALRVRVNSLLSSAAVTEATLRGDLLGVRKQVEEVGDGADAPLVTLTSTGQVFITPSNGGAISPSSVTLTATVANMPVPTYEWLVDGVVDGAATGSTYAVNSFAPTASKLIRCNVTGSDASTAFDVMSIYSLQEGSDALSAGLDNENQTIPCNSAGTPIGAVNVTATMVVARGATFLSSPAVAFSVVESTGIESAGTTTGASAHVTINATTGAISVTQITSDTASAKFRATVGSTTIDKVLTLNKSKDGADGTTGADAQTLMLTATGFAFVFPTVNSTDATAPGQIDFTAALQNVTGTVSFSATAYDSSNSALGSRTLTSVTATTCRLTANNFTTGAGFGVNVRYVRVTATLGSLSDTITIYRGDDGSSAVQAVLSNEAHVVPTASDGTGGVFTGSGTTIRVFEGVDELTYDGVGSGNGTWRVSRVNSGVSGPAVTSTGGYATNPDITSMSADTGTFTFTINGKSLKGELFEIVKIQSFAKSKAGAAGGDGNDGLRGSLTGYGTQYGLYYSTSWADNSTGTSTQRANRVIDNMLNGTSLTTGLATTSHLRVGDTVTLTDAASATNAITKYWSGTGWVTPGTVISGNLLVGGTISGGLNLNITGYAQLEGSASHTVNVLGSSSSMTTALASNTSGGAAMGVYGKSTTAGGIGVLGWNSNTTSGWGVAGEGEIGVVGQAGSANGFGMNAWGHATLISTALYASTNNTVSGSVGVDVDANATGQIGVRIDSASGTALQVNGTSSFTKQITSTLATGTAPFSITSTTEVANLNAALLKGKTWAAPDPIGATTPSTGRFTTLRVDATPTASGANAATFSALLPTGSAASTNSWMPINLNGTQYWIPVWVD